MSSDPLSSKRARLRAAKACHRCNVKRIKCDATQGIPCTRCHQSGNADDCVLRQSRRGTYVRKSKHSMGDEESQLQTSNSGDEQMVSNDPGDGVEHSQLASSSSCQQQVEEFGQEREGVEVLNGLVGRHSIPPSDVTPGSSSQVQYQTSNHINRIDQRRGTETTTTPQTSAELLSPSTSRTSVSSSYREMPWSAMFDHFLNMRQDRSHREFIDKASITYLGESFPLAIILEDFREGGMPKLHHPAPPYPGQ